MVLLRKVGRASIAATLIWTGLAVFASLVNGCVYPPVLPPKRGILLDRIGEWRSELQPTSFMLEGGTELRGAHQSAGEGTPLVLHFLESGGEVAQRAGEPHDRYARLADLGCSSLAFDYRGVGRSGGEREPGEMEADARVVYEYAVQMAGGDESRVVLRGTSLGTVMVASLLEGGARPAAVIAYAPVEAASLARRYSQQFWWSWAYWPVAPFLRTISGARTLQQLAKAECPVLIFTDPEDCFVTSGEVERLQSDAEGKPALTAVIPALKATSSSVSAPGFQRHRSLVGQAQGVRPAERDLLVSLFRQEPIVGSRVDGVLAALHEDTRTLLEADAAALRRLRVLAMADRRLFPRAAAAAALSLQGEELKVALPWVTSHWHRSMPMISHGEFDVSKVDCPATFKALLAVFDLTGGPNARWPVADIIRARSFLGSYSLVDGEPVWVLRNVEALALAIDGQLEAAAALPSSGPTSVSFEEAGDCLMMQVTTRGTSSSRRIAPAQLIAELESVSPLGAGSERSRALLALFKKAAWLP